MDIWGVVTFAFIVAANTTFFVCVNRWLGPRSRSTPVKAELFECGVPATSLPVRYPVYFYRLAVVFVLLDVELAFFLPWAVIARTLGWPGLILMGLYAGLLGVGLVYFWRHGGLVFWERPEAVPAGVKVRRPTPAAVSVERVAP